MLLVGCRDVEQLNTLAATLSQALPQTETRSIFSR
jgi:hypothetical protein